MSLTAGSSALDIRRGGDDVAALSTLLAAIAGFEAIRPERSTRRDHEYAAQRFKK